MNGAIAALDVLFRELVREAVAESADVVKREVRQLLTEELGKLAGAKATHSSEYATVKVAAKIGAVHESTIRNWIKQGKLKAYQPEPRILRVRVDELHALMAGSSNGGDGEVIDFDDRVRALTSRAARCGAKK
ncbi:MAG TPA: helix-turn-helix domain-containing protein [Polyangiaceae bacterium]|nr:helix-turn-helix domain-containing protein [Polyangiaceae bacterium]